MSCRHSELLFGNAYKGDFVLVVSITRFHSLVALAACASSLVTILLLKPCPRWLLLPPEPPCATYRRHFVWEDQTRCLLRVVDDCELRRRNVGSSMEDLVFQ